MRAMELRHLAYFVAVAEERHFGRAAQRLRMAQPPLSQQIMVLEKSLGAKLLERTTRRVDLTPAGLVLLERARILLAEVETLASDVRRIHEGAKGILRLGSTGSAAYDVLPRVLRQVRAQIPGLELELTGETLTPALVEALLEHRLDLALLRLPVSTIELEVEVVQSDDLHLAVPSDHRLATASEVHIEELRGETLVSYPATSALAGVTADLCRGVGFRPQIGQVVQETSTLISLVASGSGVSLLPAPVSVLGAGGISFLPVVGRPTVDLAVAWRRDDERPLLHALIAVIRSVTGASAGPVDTEVAVSATGTGAVPSNETRASRSPTR